MISKISFSNFLLNNKIYGKSQTKSYNPNFRGIMDNPQAQRITDGKGTTYIVEPGGHIVIHGDTSNGGKAKAVGAAAATGAGTSLAAGKISDMKSAKPDLNEDSVHNNPHEIEEKPFIESETQLNPDDAPDDFPMDGPVEEPYGEDEGDDDDDF